MQISTGKKPRAQKVVLYGPEGIGKTSLAARFPDPLFIDTEGGTACYDVKRAEPAPTSWAMLMAYVDEAARGTAPCSTLVIDTADWAERLCIAKVLADKGDSELWRLARLRWLNSTIAQDSLPIAPYQAMRLKKNVIQATEKKVRIGTDGLARSIQVNGQEVLAAPVGLEIATANNDTIRFDKGTLKMKKQADGLVTWKLSICEGRI